MIAFKSGLKSHTKSVFLVDMDALTSTIENCNLRLRLDNNTEGYGNCFPNEIVQQCRRPEVKKRIQTNNPDAFVANHYTLRRKIK